jgi:transposase
MRYVGIDLHRDFAQVSFLENGKVTRRQRVSTQPDSLHAFAKSLTKDDHVVLESTSFAWPVHTLLARHAGSVTVSNPMQTKAIAYAKVKTDKVDADMLAKLLASDMIPPVWVADDATRELRSRIAHREQIARHRKRGQISSVLQRNLIKPPVQDVLCQSGREWLKAVKLPTEDRFQINSHVRLYDAHAKELTSCDKRLSRQALDDPAARLLMTIPGVGPNAALAVIACIGDVTRFESPSKLVGYLGLAPRVRQSGNGPYRMGSISKAGDAHARHMLAEAAWAAIRVPGPMRAFYKRLRAKKAANVALIAVARKLAIVSFHMLVNGEAYRYEMPALTERKLRQLEDKTGRKPKHSQSAYMHRREQERTILEAHERAYETHANQRSQAQKAKNTA